jgi:DUF971 family protein
MEFQGLQIEPREIIDDGDSFTIRWADGAESRFDALVLRRACACASCVNEWTGERMLDPATIPDSIQIEYIGIVGRYALNFRFSDRHETGIYSFKYLRELAEKKAAT